MYFRNLGSACHSYVSVDFRLDFCLRRPGRFTSRPKVRRFRKNKFPFKAKPDQFLTLTRQKFFASFCFKFFASNQSDIKTAFFRIVSLSIIFRFVLLQFFLFRFEVKRNQRFFLCFASNKLYFPFVLLPFLSFRFRAKRNKRFFASFHFTFFLLHYEVK